MQRSTDPEVHFRSRDSDIWVLDPKVIFLNHGSFGSCPRPVLEFQQNLRLTIERQPVQFLVRDLESLLDNARGELGRFVGAEPDDLVFISNATTGINAVLRSLSFQPGDELLVTNHEYNACRNALDFVAERSRARVVVAKVPFPLDSAGQVVEAVLNAVSSRTRLALLDHVTSQTGLILPVEQLVRELDNRGVDCLIDGAHAPGMVPLNLGFLGAAYYTGNCHKWICAPKGAAFLHVRRDRQIAIRPTVISHGANSTRSDRSKFLIEFGWTGTQDPTPWLSIPEAIHCVGSMLPGGWPSVMQTNRSLALSARRILCEALNLSSPSPDAMIGSLASVPLPDGGLSDSATSPLYSDPHQDQLRNESGIEVPVIPWPATPKRLLRISAQLYNSMPQYEFLAHALKRVFHTA